MAGSEEQHPLSPTTFLSPRITAQLDNSLDAIEDILLGGSNASPSSPSTALAQTLNSNTTSANTTNQSQSLFNFTIGRERSNSYNISNAVHMEVQNNAKLPTFNIPVDRSNASWQKPAIRGRKRSSGTRHGTRSHAPSIGSGSEASANTTAPCSPIPKLRHQSDDNHMKLDTATSQAIDEIMRLNENDLNLPEYFLDDEDRASAALAYSFSGDMPQLLPTSTSLEDMSTTEGSGNSSRMPTNGLDNTTLKRQQSITRLPYRRQKPLPIPKLKPPSPKISKKRKKEGSPLETSALANGSSIDSSNEVVLPNQIEAAPIQSLKQVVATSTVTQSKNSDTMKPPRIAVPRPRTVVERPGSSSISRRKEPSLPNPASDMKLQTSLHAAAHTKPKASITHATAQRSKVGFGDNHKVPSVPGPPPCRYTPSKAASGKPTTKPKLPLHKKPVIKLPPKKFVPPTKSLPKDVGNIVAYERKKQRAKNARVKLNEAIDELGVTIDLAGSQSKERFNYIVKTSNCANPHAADDAKSRSSTIPTHPLAKLMDETIQQSASAKKWDRPSFVGLSATIIHSLNAQCEGLMREVAQLRSIAKEQMVADLDSQTSEAIVDGILQTSTPPEAKKQKLDDSLSDPVNDYTVQQAEEKLAKVMALNEQRRCLAIHNTVETPNILKNIASFLDPVSLCRCLVVCKKWRSQNIFQNVTLWLNICIKRFGVSAVRKWQDQDEETGTRKRKVDANYNTNLELYRRMSKENVKPYSTMEGTQFLGGSSLDGLVSCWVSLMDRSNSETSRSVIQQKVTNGETKQVYVPIPMVELRLLIQNTGYSKGVIIVPDQQFSVDASTRRKGEKMLEVTGDDRFKQQTLHIERSASPGEPDPQQQTSISHEMCHLRLFETAVLAIHIHAKGCLTTSKFCTKGKSIQILVSIDGTTRPLSIPFLYMNDHRSK